MKTLLLAGYRALDPNEPALGLKTTDDGTLFLDQQIAALFALGADVITVVSGPQADEQVRLSQLMAETELVFDTNNELLSLASNLKAGLTAAPGDACFVLPIEVPVPSANLWNQVKESWRQGGPLAPVHVITPTLTGAPFPLLVTPRGNRLIRDLTGFKSLLDTRLSYLHQADGTDAVLA